MHTKRCHLPLALLIGILLSIDAPVSGQSINPVPPLPPELQAKLKEWEANSSRSRHQRSTWEVLHHLRSETFGNLASTGDHSRNVMQLDAGESWLELTAKDIPPESVTAEITNFDLDPLGAAKIFERYSKLLVFKFAHGQKRLNISTYRMGVDRARERHEWRGTAPQSAYGVECQPFMVHRYLDLPVGCLLAEAVQIASGDFLRADGLNPHKDFREISGGNAEFRTPGLTATALAAGKEERAMLWFESGGDRRVTRYERRNDVGVLLRQFDFVYKRDEKGVLPREIGLLLFRESGGIHDQATVQLVEVTHLPHSMNSPDLKFVPDALVTNFLTRKQGRWSELQNQK